MTGLATINAFIRVLPGDSISATYGNSWEYIDDQTPFEFQVKSILHDEDLDLFFGLFGPVTSGPKRYHGLFCNLMVRNIPSGDWTELTATQANFKIGPSMVVRNKDLTAAEVPQHLEYFHHPDGTKLDGFPRFSRYGSVELVENPA